MVLDWPPPLKEIEKTAGGKPMMAVLFLAVFAVGVLGLLVIIVGMAISCVLLDRSSVGAKVLWFLVFFFTAPVGSMVYFFTVYKKIVATQRETVDG
jgi:multisubunit Na+/H+ antiporter MnhG subunit